MTPKERMEAALSGTLLDRVPFFPTIYIDHACIACGRAFEEALIDPVLGPLSMLGAALRYRADAVRFGMGPDASWYREKRVEKECDKLVQYDTKSGRQEGFYDVAGGGGFIPHEAPRSVRSAADVAQIEVPAAEEYLERGNLKDVTPCIEAAHANNLFAVGMCSSQTVNFMVTAMGSAEAALISFLDAPELALALINKAVEISIEKGKAFIRAGVDCLYIGDSYTSASVISPDIYERFCIPAYREVAEEFHRLGAFCYKHCCGNYNPFLGSFPRTGVDAMDGIDPTSGMTVAHTKKKIGKDTCLIGGLSCLTLLNGTPEQVYDEARRCIAAGKPDGRYVLGSACAVPRHTPPENLLAAHAAAVDHGGDTRSGVDANRSQAADGLQDAR